MQDPSWSWPRSAARTITAFGCFAAIRATALVAAVLILSAVPAAAQLDKPLVKVQLRWSHQAQFAGYYVAKEIGFYDREGIDVEFAPGGPYVRPMTVLGLGGVDVAIGWVSDAMEARVAGLDVVNIAQVFQKPAMMLVCWRDIVGHPSDVKGKTIGVWNVGDQFDVAYWLHRNGIATNNVSLQAQRPNAVDFLNRSIDCATAMSYNEYVTILEKGIAPSSLFVVRFGSDGSALLEDGLYSRGQALADSKKRDLLARFLRASAAGWRYADQNRDEAVTITKLYAPLADTAHQRRMLDAVLRLMTFDHDFGILNLNEFEQSIESIGLGTGNPKALHAATDHAWTHSIWYAAALQGAHWNLLTESVRHNLVKVVESTWFYFLILLGTATFALSGFMQAQQLRYDMWGAFVLAFLPAVGGGTLRDIMIGGERQPLFIFSEPIFLYLIIGVTVFGFVMSRLLPADAPQSRPYHVSMTWLDTMGLATMTVVGAKVALVAGLTWYWVPICAAISSAGGGVLLTMVTARQPHTFQGEPYEEIAILGGLVMLGGLLIANYFEHAPWIVAVTILATLVMVFAVRMIVIRYGLRSFRLGM